MDSTFCYGKLKHQTRTIANENGRLCYLWCLPLIIPLFTEPVKITIVIVCILTVGILCTWPSISNFQRLVLASDVYSWWSNDFDIGITLMDLMLTISSFVFLNCSPVYLINKLFANWNCAIYLKLRLLLQLLNTYLINFSYFRERLIKWTLPERRKTSY